MTMIAPHRDTTTDVSYMDWPNVWQILVTHSTVIGHHRREHMAAKGQRTRITSRRHYVFCNKFAAFASPPRLAPSAKSSSAMRKRLLRGGVNTLRLCSLATLD